MTMGAKVRLAWLVLVAALVALPPAARAQSTGPAAGDWEFALGPWDDFVQQMNEAEQGWIEPLSTYLPDLRPILRP